MAPERDRMVDGVANVWEEIMLRSLIELTAVQHLRQQNSLRECPQDLNSSWVLN